ncbi:MAG: PAS domain-containing protein [Candidatus Didemnitutus sp.]|nr:PAS domain-containing protein [Candidatus Didemnitutus sp.]
MRTRSVAIQDAPREFALHEVFFSTTDRKGVITSGNSVFVRVSGFQPGELVGQPHNIIRHPDMPRAAFRLLWRTLAAGKSFVALVKNLAKDGRYYWVVAFIMPVADGYLSIRFKPSSPLLAEVEPLYARMRAAEREHGDGGEAGRAGMDAAERLLGEALQALGFASYEAFMWTLLQVEMKSRDAGLRAGASEKGRGIVAAEGAASLAAHLQAIHESGRRACAQIDRLYHRLGELTGFGADLMKKSAFVTDLTREIRFVALSTSLEATRLGEMGSTLGVIAQFLGTTSTQTADEVARLTRRIRDITAEMQEVSYHLSGARLQIEMVLIFCDELLAGGTGTVADARHGPARMIAELKGAFAATAAKALGLLNSLGAHLHELNGDSEGLRKTMLMLQVAQISGLVETSRIRADSAVGSIFDEVRRHVLRTSEELGQLGEITGDFAGLVQATPEIERAVLTSVGEMEEHVARLETVGVG